MDRWCRMMKIAPHETRSSYQNSWNENANNLLSTEKKVFAIKVTEGDYKTNHQFPLKRKKKRIYVFKKWIDRCKWKLPKAMILFSVLQVWPCWKLSYLWATVIKLCSLLTAFLPLHRSNGSRISNISLLSSSKTRTLALLHLFPPACWTCPPFNKRCPSTCHRVTAWIWSRSYERGFCLCFWCSERITGSKCFTWFLANGWC